VSYRRGSLWPVPTILQKKDIVMRPVKQARHSPLLKEGPTMSTSKSIFLAFCSKAGAHDPSNTGTTMNKADLQPPRSHGLKKHPPFDREGLSTPSPEPWFVRMIPPNRASVHPEIFQQARKNMAYCCFRDVGAARKDGLTGRQKGEA